MSTPDRHARVSALFLAALDVPPSERTAWLNAETSDPDLLELVSSMLAEHEDDTPAFFEEPLVSRPPDDRLIGQTIRGWTLTDRLGQGGMGSVYRAERADETFDQTAALKLVRPGFEHDFGVRFVRERALLASLDHPGIARLLDGGMTEDGAPYLAMELADGQPITTYAEDRQLDVPARLRLFLQACDAVAYAHRSLVVHRDLKPAHMLVTDGSGEEATDKRQGGMPSSSRIKLLDFGIAKLLDSDDELLTRTGGGPMTPAYAAPEQILRQPVTTATDVYALGMVLFELLAGTRPYNLTTLTASQIEQVVSQNRPPRPSDVAPRPRARQLEGDLDTIVLKALSKEPERRYDSAAALAEDLRRHLDGLPVQARPDTVGYRLGKFVGRHRAGVTATALVVALLATLIGVYTVRLGAERDRAQDEAERSEAVASFLEQILRAPNTRWYNEAEASGPETPIRAVLDEAAARIERDFTDQPDLRADLHHIIGDTYVSLGLIDEAKPHHLATLALRESLYTPPHPKIAEALYYANGYLADGDPQRALEISERTLDMMREVPGGNNFPFLAHATGRSYREAGRLDEAEAALREGFAYAEATFVPGHDGYRYRGASMMASAHRLAQVLMDQGSVENAARWLATTDSLLALLPRRSAHHDRWRALMCSHGRLLRLQSQYTEAEQALLACTGEGPPRGLASPFPVPDDAPPPAPSGEASFELAALYDAWGRPEEAAPYRSAAARFAATRDSLRQVYVEE